MNQAVTNPPQSGFPEIFQHPQMMGAPISVPNQLITNPPVNIDTPLQQKYRKILRSLGVSLLVKQRAQIHSIVWFIYLLKTTLMGF